MLHTSCVDVEVAFEYMHVNTSKCSPCLWSAWRRSGTLCRFVFERRLSVCALQTFLLPLTHNLAKVPPSAVPSTVSDAIVVCARRLLSAD